MSEQTHTRSQKETEERNGELTAKADRKSQKPQEKEINHLGNDTLQCAGLRVKFHLYFYIMCELYIYLTCMPSLEASVRNDQRICNAARKKNNNSIAIKNSDQMKVHLSVFGPVAEPEKNVNQILTSPSYVRPVHRTLCVFRYVPVLLCWRV